MVKTKYCHTLLLFFLLMFPAAGELPDAIEQKPLFNQYLTDLQEEGWVQVIDLVYDKSFMDSEGFTIREVRTQRGFFNESRMERLQKKGYGQAKKDSSTLYFEVMNEKGELLYREPLVFPVIMTVPPPPAPHIKPPDDMPGSVTLTKRESSLIIPFIREAYSFSLVLDGKAILTDKKKLEKAREVFFEQKAINKKEPPIIQSRNPDTFNLMILASGFSKAETDAFLSRAEEISSLFLSVEPFKNRREVTNIILEPQYQDLGCKTGCKDIEWLMCCNSLEVMSAVARSGQEADEIIILHNTPNYSGGAYREDGIDYQKNSLASYAMVYNGDWSASMALHEFGHSFGNLCEEYIYTSEGYSYEPCVNCRPSCEEWAHIETACHEGCDAEVSFFRPGKSIMLYLTEANFNQASLKATYFPHGLEKRLHFFLSEDMEPVPYLPDQPELAQNFPNPFNSQTTISFQLPEKMHVTLKVYDLLGREVALLFEGLLPEGEHSVQFDAQDLTGGVYFYRLEAGEEAFTRSMTFIK